MALVLVTGASTGLGLATATALIDDGHDVVLQVRNDSRLDGRDLRSRARGVVLGDLARREEIIGVAEQANAYGRFDSVVHNAGILDGPELLAVNVLAPYLLTASMPLPSRAVFVSSSMHLSGRPSLNNLGFGGGDHSYSDSKLLVTTFALALASRYPSLLSHAVDPGWVPTRMGGPAAPDDLVEGHRTQVWLATAAEAEITPRSGGYWHHHQQRQPHPAATDSRFQRELLAQLAISTGVSLLS